MKNGKKIPTIEQLIKKHKVSRDYIEKQIAMGIKVEHEHTKDDKVAMGIALQHLDEFPDYYTRLKKAESGSKKIKSMKEETKSGDKGLHDWFNKSKSSTGKPGWVQLGGKYAGKPCARQPGQTSTPKCGSSKMKRDLSKDEEQKASERKNRLDPNQPEKTGAAKPTNVRTEEMNLQEVKDKPGKGSGKKDACYHKVKARYDVWPSAYASGALVKCRKAGAKNWGNKSEAVEEKRYCSLCNKMESRNECSYGPSAWDMNSVKEHCGCEDSLDKVVLKAKKEKQRKNYLLNNKNITENYSRINEYGGTYTIALNWRNKTFVIQIFFPSAKVPTRAEVQKQIEKIYPNSFLVYYRPSAIDPAKPLLFKTEEVEYIEEKTPAWQRSEGKNPEGGLNKKGIESYRKEHPGSKLSLAVTTKPSKLKKGSKSAKRRKSFCARMSGMKKRLTSAKTANDPNSRINKSLRKWNC